jgi:hypothetical protein
MTTRIPTVTALVLAAVAPTASADTPTEPARPRVAVAAADPQAPTPTELALLLAPVAETPAPSTSTPVRRTPRFALAAGPYTTTRALAFAVAETTPVDELPETPPESTLVGARIEVAIFPAGGADRRGRLVGPGVTASYRHSVGGSAGYDDLDAEESWDLPVIDAGWSLGLRYRQPLGPALVEVGLSHDSASRRVDERPDWLELPDAEYRSVAGSLRLELSLRPGAVIALGGSYHHVLDAGELMAVDGYGAGTITERRPRAARRRLARQLGGHLGRQREPAQRLEVLGALGLGARGRHPARRGHQAARLVEVGRPARSRARWRGATGTPSARCGR